MPLPVADDVDFVLLDFDGNRASSGFRGWPADILDRSLLVLGSDEADIPNSIDSYVNRILDKVPGSGCLAIVTYCNAVGLGQELAATMATRTARAPLLVAVDPTRPTMSDFIEVYHETVREIGMGRHVDPLAISAEDLVERSQEILRLILNDIHERCAESIGLSNSDLDFREIVADVASRYSRWVRYAFVVCQVDWTRRIGRVVQICSEGHGGISDWPGALNVATLPTLLSRSELLAESASLDIIRSLV